MLRCNAIFYGYDFTGAIPKVIFKEVLTNDAKYLKEAFVDARELMDYIGNIICLSGIEFTCDAIEGMVIRKVRITEITNKLVGIK